MLARCRSGGQTAHLEIVDNHSGAWGHIEIDQIEFSDQPPAQGKLEDQPDFGSMCLVLLQDMMKKGPWLIYGMSNETFGQISSSTTPLEAGESQSIIFAITWHFPNLTFATTRWDPRQKISPSDVIEKGRHYATRFDSATAVAKYLADHHEQLYQQTKLWRDTWYDSTLPYWFLDRTIANISTLATSTSYRFANGATGAGRALVPAAAPARMCTAMSNRLVGCSPSWTACFASEPTSALALIPRPARSACAGKNPGPPSMAPAWLSCARCAIIKPRPMIRS